MRKRQAFGRRGAAAAKHPAATAAALEMLQRGGNAVDAAVAAAFCSGVVEPWMSGVGGGGFMVIRLASGRTVAIDFGMQAPAAAAPDMYPLAEGVAGDLFPWRRVQGDVNVHGPLSVAVPGAVPGLCLALERFGRLDLATVLQPAIRAAEEGFEVDWFTTLAIAVDAATVRRYPETARVFLPGGLPPGPADSPPPRRLRQPDLARTLRILAERGPEAFTHGEIAEAIVAAVRRDGGILSLDDLAGYRPIVVEDAPAFPYRDAQVFTSPDPSGGPFVAEILGGLASVPMGALGPRSVDAWDALVSAARAAYGRRFAGAAGAGGAAGGPAGVVGPLGAVAADNGGAPAPEPHESTTHLSVVDGDGNLVSLTSTLLSRFGSRYTVEGTGILLNNGMFWFDPEPGKPLSVAGGRRPPSNMAPVVVVLADGSAYAVGSSGGRRIIGCNAHLVVNLVDFGMPLQRALEAPRVDCTGPHVLVDQRLGRRILHGLARRGHPVVEVEESFYPRFFASPTAAGIDPHGRFVAAADPFFSATAGGL